MAKSPSLHKISLLLLALLPFSTVFSGCGKGPEEIDQVATNAEIAILHGDYEKAARLFDIVATSDMATEEIFYNLGVALDKAGKTSEAATAFRQAIALTPGDTDAKEYLAAILHRTGNPNEAAQLLKQVLPTRGKGLPRARALNSLAIAELDIGQESLALLHFLEAKRLSPSYGPTYFNLGKLYGKDLHLHAEAIKLLERFTRIENGDGQQITVANRLLAELRELPSPERQTPGTPSPTVRKLIGQGDEALSQKRLDRASVCFAKALAEDPSSYEAAVKLANTEFNRGRYAEALRACRTASKNDPESFVPVYLEAQIAYVTRELKHALDILVTRAIPRWPYQPSSYRLAAYTLSQINRQTDVAPFARAFIETSRIRGEDPSDFIGWVKSFLPDFQCE